MNHNHVHKRCSPDKTVDGMIYVSILLTEDLVLAVVSFRLTGLKGYTVEFFLLNLIDEYILYLLTLSLCS